MPAADLQFATRTLAKWARNHGIHQVRAVLQQAADDARTSPDSETLASLLEDQAKHITDTPTAKPKNNPAVNAPPAAKQPAVVHAEQST